MTPELGCSGRREHSSSCSGDQPEYGCDSASRVPLQSADATVRRVFRFGPLGCSTTEADSHLNSHECDGSLTLPQLSPLRLAVCLMVSGALLDADMLAFD